jgi:pumilio RNA-binding family
VIQWVIEKGETVDRSHVISVIYGQVLALAHQKFASNVVEKCIMHGTPEERRRLIDEILTPAPDGSSAIKSMLAGAFSNYVVQQALRWSVGAQREAVYDETAVHFMNLRKYSTANSKHLITSKLSLTCSMLEVVPSLTFRPLRSRETLTS